MRVLLVVIAVVCFLICGLAVLSSVTLRAEQIDMRAELSQFQAAGGPPSDAILDNHSARIGRLRKRWGLVGVLATFSGIAALTCLGLSVKRKGPQE